MTEFRKWKSINKFADAVKLANRNGIRNGVVSFKIKLHGTNAGIRLIDQTGLRAQKRSSDVFPDNDNAGFARWVQDNVIRTSITTNDGWIIYGEWAGKGVQKSDAVSEVAKDFYVFGLYDPATDTVVVEPENVQTILATLVETDMKVLPWYQEMKCVINFTETKSCQDLIDWAVNEVDKHIAKCDPYIKDIYGVEGPGEGLVGYLTQAFYLDGGPVPAEYMMEYTFKVKTDEHTVQKNKKKNNVGIEKPEGTEDFVQTFVTEARCQQMLDQIGGEADRKKTGDFLKAIMTDIHKESVNEILIADFEFKDVAKYVQTAARIWFFNKCDEL